MPIDKAAARELQAMERDLKKLQATLEELLREAGTIEPKILELHEALAAAHPERELFDEQRIRPFGVED